VKLLKKLCNFQKQRAVSKNGAQVPKTMRNFQKRCAVSKNDAELLKTV
jgi:hypothetical protein